MAAQNEIHAVFHPTDFSPASELAFAHALKIALCARAALQIAHVDAEPPEEIDWTAFPPVRKTLAGWGLIGADVPRRSLADRLGIKIGKVDIVARDPVNGILDYLEHHPAELIVLATHGRDGLPRWLHGSVAEPLARGARTGTLFIHHDEPGFVGPESGKVCMNRVLIPVDHRPRPQAAVAEAWRLMQLLGARDVVFHLVHIGDARNAPVVLPPPDMIAPMEQSVRDGEVVGAIAAAAADLEADLIVMPTEGRHGFLDAVRGSASEQVLRRVRCPVLAIPEREAG